MFALRRRRLVRLHLLENAPSIEGVLIGRPNGFFRLAQPEILEAVGRTHTVEGEAWVPSSRVLWMQDLGGPK